MNRAFGPARWTVVVALLAAFSQQAALGQDGDTKRVLESIPAKFPLAVVFVNATKLDTSVTAFSKRTGTNFAKEGLVKDIVRQLPMLAWLDLTQPIGLAYASLEGAPAPIVYARVADFSAKAKTLDEATEENGVWRLTFDRIGVIYARVDDDFVVASSFNENLALPAGERSLADTLKSQPEIWRGRDVLVHVNAEPLRDTITKQLDQIAATAPMMAMLAAGQGGDPASIVTTLTTIFDAAKRVAAQIDRLDLSLSVNESTATLSLSSTFRDGPIKSHIANAKPSDHAPFSGLRDQPYIMAIDYGFPGNRSPVMEFLFDKFAAPDATAAGEVQAEQAMRELYRKVRGANALLSHSSDGARMAGTYFGADPKAILRLATQALSAPNPTLTRMKAGMKFEPLGQRKVGDISVNEFAAIPDTSNGVGAAFATLVGDRPRLTLGVTSAGVGFCMGDEGTVALHFAGEAGKPFRRSRHVAAALAALLPKRNITFLVDPAALLPLGAPLFGTEVIDPISSGPPIAVGITLSGGTTRLDLHVPARAIARYHQMLAPPEPL